MGDTRDTDLLTSGWEWKAKAEPKDFGLALGEMIGAYKLLEVLGEGGFGMVFLAERREPHVQRVALTECEELWAELQAQEEETDGAPGEQN